MTLSATQQLSAPAVWEPRLKLPREVITTARRRGRLEMAIDVTPKLRNDPRRTTASYDFGPLFLPTLLVLMSVKFWLVVLFFMHLKFDAKIFGRLFWTGLLLALGVYAAALATFQVFYS